MKRVTVELRPWVDMGPSADLLMISRLYGNKQAAAE